MTYCYLGIEVSLKALFLHPNCYNLVEEHRSRVNVPEGTLSDIYDGNMWSDYQYYNGKGLLSDALSLGLMINVDWFQPYKHINYSVGAIYVVILNLPRNLHYKRENVLLVGIIPGPCESKHDINSYLTPLVNELLLFVDGVNIHVHGFSTQKLVKCVLLCASCDVPAGRKTCGFIQQSLGVQDA